MVTLAEVNRSLRAFDPNVKVSPSRRVDVRFSSHGAEVLLAVDDPGAARERWLLTQLVRLLYRLNGVDRGAEWVAPGDVVARVRGLLYSSDDPSIEELKAALVPLFLFPSNSYAVGRSVELRDGDASFAPWCAVLRDGFSAWRFPNSFAWRLGVAWKSFEFTTYDVPTTGEAATHLARHARMLDLAKAFAALNGGEEFEVLPAVDAASRPSAIVEVPRCRVELDCTNPRSTHCATWCEAHHVKVNVLEERGPAGGNPLVEFTGSRGTLERFIDEHFDDADLKERIEDEPNHLSIFEDSLDDSPRAAFRVVDSDGDVDLTIGETGAATRLRDLVASL